MANEGIGGTTSVTECPGLPSSYQALAAGPRLSRDVLALHGVTGVIFYYGTNDLQDGCSSAQILASYVSVFERLHDAGFKVYVVPTTPRPIYTDQMNLYRDGIHVNIAGQRAAAETIWLSLLLSSTL